MGIAVGGRGVPRAYLPRSRSVGGVTASARERPCARAPRPLHAFPPISPNVCVADGAAATPEVDSSEEARRFARRWSSGNRSPMSQLAMLFPTERRRRFSEMQNERRARNWRLSFGRRATVYERGLQPKLRPNPHFQYFAINLPSPRHAPAGGWQNPANGESTMTIDISTAKGYVSIQLQRLRSARVRRAEPTPVTFTNSKSFAQRD